MKIKTIMPLILLFLMGCAHLEPGQESWEHRIGRVSSMIVLDNNPSYIPDVEQRVQDGLALLTGENIDPVAVLQGINDFVAKLMKEDYEEYHVIISEVLSYVKGLFDINVEVSEDKQRMADSLKEFLEGVQEGIQYVKEGRL